MRQTLLFIITCCLCVLASSENAVAAANGYFQQIQKDSVPARVIPKVRITIRDLADGKPIDSVMVTMSSKKAYTNALGYAELDSVQKESIIIASKNGYLVSSKKAKREVTIRIEKNESSSIPQYSNGLYARPVEHFSGAYTVVPGAELRKANPLNFIEALKVFAPSFIVTKNNNYGDDPNFPAAVDIRGGYNFPASVTIAEHMGVATSTVQLNPSNGDFIANNIANPNQPVILLDGVQVALQTVLDLDINRIDKVTILKDAAATAPYGVRGGNGVLFIQTKKPTAGSFNVTYSAQVQIATPDLSSYNMMNAADKLQLENAAGLYNDNAALYQKRLSQVNNGVNTDWLSIPTRNGIGTKHYIALDGGDDDLSYGLDFSYNNVAGTMKGSNRKNTNIGGYISTRIKTLTVSNYISYTSSNTASSPYGNLVDYTKQNPYWNPYDTVKGSFAKILEEYTYQGNIIRNFNPAYDGILSTTYGRLYSKLSDWLSVNWNIGNGFKANGRVSFSKQSDEENVFRPPSHTAFALYTPNDFFKRGTYDQTLSEFTSLEGALNLGYTKRIALHQLYASAGISAMQTSSESAGIQLAGFTSDKLTDIAFGKAYSNNRPETGIIKTRLASAYGNFTYSYDNRYQVEITGNADESSQFGKNNQVAPHWAAGASWNLHQERFFRENKMLNSLRIRGSVGTAGNLFFQSYLGRTRFNYYTDRQYVPAGSGIGTRGIGLGAFLAGFANENLKSPETKKQNIGLDAVLLQNRLFVTVDAYRNQTKDIVLPVTSPASTGFQNFNYYDNLGAIESKGVEFTLNYRIISNTRKGIVWSAMVNGIHHKDRIQSVSNYLEAHTTASDGPLVDQTRPQPRYVVGQSLTAIWAVRSSGIDAATGNERFLNADGTETFTWNAANKTVAGDLSPTLQGTFGTTFTVKNISAGLYCYYQFGASYYNQTLADYVENADLNYNVDARAAHNRWTKPGDVALYKAVSVNGMVTSPTYVTTRFVEKNNLINFTTISLSYSLPERIVSKARAKNAKLGFIANNAFQTSNANVQQGIYAPFQRNYTFSLTTNF
jgi:TonB-linked SusC/RagA family outer membrane protein